MLPVETILWSGLSSWKLGPGTDAAGVGLNPPVQGTESQGAGPPATSSRPLREISVPGLLCDLLELYGSNLLQIQVGGAQT